MGIGAAVAGIATAYSAKKGADAAKSAGKRQARATDRAAAEQRRQFNITREDLAPYREAGEEALPGLVDLSTDPNAQRDFVMDNPFFQALADESQDRLFSNQAAKGKVGSGETAEALQNSILLLGNDLLNQGIQRRQNLVSGGQNAAVQTGQFGAESARTIADLTTSGAAARAAGTVGAANARTRGVQNIVNTGAQLYGYNQMTKALG